MTLNEPRWRPPTIFHDAKRNPGFAAGAFGLSAWAYVGMSHTIADYEGPELGYGLGVAYEALVIGMAWEGRRRAEQCLEAGRPITGHRRWLLGAIGVGVISGALAAWHGWSKGEGVFAASRAVAPILAAVAVHLFFQSAASARDLERKAQIEEEREVALLEWTDAARSAEIAAPELQVQREEVAQRKLAWVERNVPAAMVVKVTRPHMERVRTLRTVEDEIRELARLRLPRMVAEEEPKQLVSSTVVSMGDPGEASGAGVGEDVVGGAESVTSSAVVSPDTRSEVAVVPAESSGISPITPSAGDVEVADDTGHIDDVDGDDVSAPQLGVMTPAHDAGSDMTRRAWRNLGPAAARAVTPYEGESGTSEEAGADSLFEQLSEDATQEERQERAQKLAQKLGKLGEDGRKHLSTEDTKQIAMIVDRSARQVRRYVETTDTGSIPVVDPVASGDTDQEVLDHEPALAGSR